mmetsp:Transcript_19916/g.79398  ORF Transcript_19916/g.79398 Transcript_19916/m.79398 type:complete len:491 (+) Transcript_19916:727-2199(+)
MRRRRRSLHGGRLGPPHQRVEHGPRDGRLRPRVFLVHLGPHVYGRRQRHGPARWISRAGPRIRPIPPDRHLRRRVFDHRRLARRGRRPPELRGRAVHGAVRAVSERPRVPRRRVPGDDDGDPRGSRRRRRQRPHLSPPRPPAARAPRRTAAGHLGDGGHLRGGRRHQRADPRVAHRALQHGRRPDEPLRRGHPAAQGGRWLYRVARRGRAWVVRRGRGRFGLGPRREPARRQLVARHRRFRQGVRSENCRHRQTGPADPAGARGRFRSGDRFFGRDALRRRRDADRGDPARHAEDDAGPRRGLSGGRLFGGGRPEDRRRRRLVRRRRHPGPVAHLEHGPHRDARAPQLAAQRGHHDARGFRAQGVARRPRARRLRVARRQRLDEAHHGLRRLVDGPRRHRLPPRPLRHARRERVRLGAARRARVLREFAPYGENYYSYGEVKDCRPFLLSSAGYLVLPGNRRLAPLAWVCLSRVDVCITACSRMMSERRT